MLPKVFLLTSLATLATSMQHQAPMDYSVHHSARRYDVPAQRYLEEHPEDTGSTPRVLMASAFVVDTAARLPRLLLVQRSHRESRPGRWEPPGGLIEPSDRTILQGLRRKLDMETGLALRHVRRFVNQYTFRAGRKFFTKCSFLVDAAHHQDNPMVRLDPATHQDHIWVTENEVRAGEAARAGGRGHISLKFIDHEAEATVKRAFSALRREYGGRQRQTSSPASSRASSRTSSGSGEP